MSVIASQFSRVPQRDPLAIFLFVSVLLHLFFFFLLPQLERHNFAPPLEQLAEVELLPPSPPAPTPPVTAKVQPPPVEKDKPLQEQEKKVEEKPQQQPLPEQIVSPPDNVNDQIPEKTRLLSDRNSSTKEETVAIGAPLPSQPQKEKPIVKEKPQTPKPPTQLAMKTPQMKAEPKPPIEKVIEKEQEKPKDKSSEAQEKIEQIQKDRALSKAEVPAKTPQLFARPDDLLTQGWLSDAGEEREKHKAERQPPQGRDLIAMAPPPAENLLSLPGPVGTPDVLPDVRQGSLTFLNAKAHRFAPFVRRVAMRVFQYLIIHYRQLKLDDVVAAHEMVTVQAKLDVQGNLKKLVIQTRSGSYAVDSSLLDACKQGAWDENPPVEAKAEDGYINFIFRSNITAQYDQLGLRAISTYLATGLL